MKEFNFTLQIKGEENRIIGNIVQNDTANRFNIRLKDGVQVVELEETDVITVTFKRNNDSVVIDSIGSDSVVVTDGVMGEIAVIPDEGAVINVTNAGGGDSTNVAPLEFTVMSNGQPKTGA